MKLGLIREGKPLTVEVTLDKSTSSSASAEQISPALQGATLSDGQLKTARKAFLSLPLRRAARPRRQVCIRTT